MSAGPAAAPSFPAVGAPSGLGAPKTSATKRVENTPSNAALYAGLFLAFGVFGLVIAAAISVGRSGHHASGPTRGIPDERRAAGPIAVPDDIRPDGGPRVPEAVLPTVAEPAPAPAAPEREVDGI